MDHFLRPFIVQRLFRESLRLRASFSLFALFFLRLFITLRMIGYAIGPYLIADLTSLPIAIFIAPFIFSY